MFMFYLYDDEPGYTPEMIEIDEDDLAEDELEFFNDGVRKAWDYKNEEWYLSVVDVVKVLTDSEEPATYWRVLKKRLRDEGNQTVTDCNGLDESSQPYENIVRLKMKAATTISYIRRKRAW